jgi:hypothetical protein
MNEKEFIQGVDYYLEDGRIHFTKEYLLKTKKQCCGNVCRHCCYTERVKGNTELRKDAS